MFSNGSRNGSHGSPIFLTDHGTDHTDHPRFTTDSQHIKTDPPRFATDPRDHGPDVSRIGVGCGNSLLAHLSDPGSGHGLETCVGNSLLANCSDPGSCVSEQPRLKLNLSFSHAHTPAPPFNVGLFEVTIVV